MLSQRTYGRGALAGLPDVSMSIAYDGNGNRIRMTDPSGPTTYEWDDGDRLSQITNPWNELFSIGFDSQGRVSQIARPGSVSRISYDPTHFLNEILHESTGGALISSFGYTRDAAGQRVTSTKDGLYSQSFGYDGDHQLTSSTNPEAASTSYENETFSYDSTHNRTSDNQGAYTFDTSGQRLLEDYRYLYIWDQNGNLISKQGKGMTGEVTQYLYTSENQLKEVRFFASPTATTPWKTARYFYDALGRRVQKVVSDTTAPSDVNRTFTRKFAYDGEHILREYDGSNQLLARYTHPPQLSKTPIDDVLSVQVTTAGVAAGMAQATGSYQFLKDALGTIHAVANSSGVRVAGFVYSAYGILLATKDGLGNDATANPPVRFAHLFTGREFDIETGLYYFRARYLDPLIGRFLQVDPKEGSAASPSTIIQRYAYGGNNPVSAIDPDGQFFFLIAALFTGAAVATVFTVGKAIVTGQWDWSFFAKVMSAAIAIPMGAAVGVCLALTMGPALVGAGIGALVASAIATTVGSLVGGLAAGVLNMTGYAIAGFSSPRDLAEAFMIGFAGGAAVTGIVSSVVGVTGTAVTDATLNLASSSMQGVGGAADPLLRGACTLFSYGLLKGFGLFPAGGFGPGTDALQPYEGSRMNNLMSACMSMG